MTSIGIDVCTVPHADQRVRGYKLTCGQCGAEGRIPFNTLQHGSGVTEQDRIMRLVAQKFEATGWKVGKKPRLHRCPDCVRAARAAQMRYVHAVKDDNERRRVLHEVKKPVPEREDAVLDQTTTTPKEMSRADRRVIFAKLEEVYADEQTGYQQGWGDQKVATDLGVPIEWVCMVREENFGPCASSPEVDAALAELRAWRTDAANLAAAAAALKAQFDRFTAEARTLASRGELLERKVAGIEKIVGRAANSKAN